MATLELYPSTILSFNDTDTLLDDEKTTNTLQNSITTISNDYCQNYFLFQRKWTIGILIVTIITVAEYQSEYLMNLGLVNIFEQ